MSFLLALAAVTTPIAMAYPWPVPNARDRKNFERYRACVVSTARLLEKSDAAVGDIFAASDFRCREIRTRVLSLISAENLIPLSTDKGNETEEDYEMRYEKLVTWLTSDLRGEVADAILSVRVGAAK